MPKIVDTDIRVNKNNYTQEKRLNIRHLCNDNQNMKRI